MPSRGPRPTIVSTRPFTPLHRSTFGRLPEQEGEGEAAGARRGGGASAGGRVFFGENTNYRELKPLLAIQF